MNTSLPLANPDGLRATLDGTALLMAEGGADVNRVDLVTVDGDNATITAVKDGFNQPTGVAQIGNNIYVVESRLRAGGCQLELGALPAATD